MKDRKMNKVYKTAIIAAAVLMLLAAFKTPEYVSVFASAPITQKKSVPYTAVNIGTVQGIETLEKTRYRGEGVLTPSGVTAEELAAALNGPMKEYAEIFLEAERRTGINAFFLTAVAGLESGWGKSPLARNRNNLFGWTGKSGYMAFDSVEQCIFHVADCLKEFYLTEGGKYFNGYTVGAVNMRYNGRPEWERMVNDIMGGITRRANAARASF